MYRNTPHGKPQWTRPVFTDMTPQNILWDSFLGDAPKTPFDANRYINWRFFWDYSGGNFHENMCHQLAFWYKVLGLGIPSAVTATGGIYLWKDGREVPDTMDVSMQHPEEILFTWNSGFGNNQYGVTEDVLGADGSISRGQQIPLFAAEGEPARRHRDARADRHPQERAHAEFPGFHPFRRPAQLPLRPGLQRFHRLPDGGLELSRGPHRALGSG